MIVDFKSADEHMIWPSGLSGSVAHVEAPAFAIPSGSYERHVNVHPAAAYAHDLVLVEELVARACELFPLRDRARLTVIDRCSLGRWNGITWEAAMWRHADGSDWPAEEVPCGCSPGCKEILKFHGQDHSIVLFGSVVPPMRQFTRYLVAHEYGHAAFNRTCRLLRQSNSREDKLIAEYMLLRGIEWPKRAPNAMWHELASEVVANDFRVLVMSEEVEHWPHDVCRPNSATADWWAHAASLAIEDAKTRPEE